MRRAGGSGDVCDAQREERSRIFRPAGSCYVSPPAPTGPTGAAGPASGPVGPDLRGKRERRASERPGGEHRAELRPWRQLTAVGRERRCDVRPIGERTGGEPRVRRRAGRNRSDRAGAERQLAGTEAARRNRRRRPAYITEPRTGNPDGRHDETDRVEPAQHGVTDNESLDRGRHCGQLSRHREVLPAPG